MRKTIFILCDGLRKDTAISEMGYLHQLTDKNKASFYTIRTETPTLSRVMYESICTGTSPDDHGITSNLITRRSKMPNIFQIISDHHISSIAVAYFWFSELYIHYPFDPLTDKDINPPTLSSKLPRKNKKDQTPIQFGRFYEACTLNNNEDVINTGAALIYQHNPGFAFLHPMSIDETGHQFTPNSKQYRVSVRLTDNFIGRFLDDWGMDGYDVFVGSDHGINSDGQHGGSSDELRDTPLYYIPHDKKGKGWSEESYSQLALAPTLLALMDLPVPETMQIAPLKLS